MKNIKYITRLVSFLLLIGMSGCQDNNHEFGTIITPSNIQITAEIVGKDATNPNGDGSGVVHFTVKADNATSYKFVYNGNTSVAPSGKKTYNFSKLGVHTYTITVVATGTAGVVSSKAIQVEVLATYSPPADLLQKLYGNGSKTWRIKSEKAGHFGLGPIGGTVPSEWYGAGPDEKASVGMYDDRYIFKNDGTFTHITNSTNDTPTVNTDGTVFGRVKLIDELGTGSGTVNGADVENFVYSDYNETWSLTAPGGVETLNLTGLGFIGYYVGGNHTYQIYDRSVPNELHLRVTDGNNEFDWWFIITSEAPQSNMLNTIYNNLVWEDDFNTNGAPDAAKWAYDIGTGNNGWGNGEAQYYTNRADNVKVENGNLVITAKKENHMGSNYTSARIKTQGLYEFTYGRVEIRAKLPQGGGTWPALWMLGANFPTVGWPACGEIDIMEHKGNEANKIYGTVHYANGSGGVTSTGKTTMATNVSSEFHLYTIEWKPNEILVAVDNEVYFTFPNNSALPFDHDFFLIFNVAMGGTFGGNIDAGFTQSTMEVDYVKVYQ